MQIKLFNKAMTLQELTLLVRQKFDRCNLKRNVRYNALNHVAKFIREKYNGNLEVLYKPKDEFKRLYENYKDKKINGAESSAINEIYKQFSSGSFSYLPKTSVKSVSTTNIKPQMVECSKPNVEELMNDDNFMKVSVLSDVMIPDKPGLYAIKIKDVNDLPSPFCDELVKRNHNLLYIGMASDSLLQRFWNEELHNEKPATFFRSIGAILGYRPVKGSLVDNENKKNYKFCPVDTVEINKWISGHLLVNCMVVIAYPYKDKDGKENKEEKKKNTKLIEDMETQLIQMYKPIVNIAKNPYKMVEVSELREECRRIANDSK